MIRKVLSFEIKEVKDRVLEFVGSTEDKDRMGDVIMASGWQLKNYKKNPVFLWAHKYDTPPVGKAVKVWLDDNRLKFHIQFATPEEYEFADTIYKLYKGGYLRATSVGFMPIESEPIEKEDEDTFFRPTRYLKQDLLELSACPVPANPNALAEAKAKGLVGDEVVQQLDEAEKTAAWTDSRSLSADTITITPNITYDVLTDTITYILPEDEDGLWEEIKSAISYESAHSGGTPKAGEDEEWDAGKEVAAAEVEDMKVMCAIIQGDPDIKGSYKLPHHKASGKHPVVWQGVAAAGAVLMGARGGIDATDAEKTGAKAHIAKHYEEFDRTPPWKEEAAKYLCECVDCGYEVETEEHCRDIECPKCGGDMRRTERPGPGKTGQAMIADEMDYLLRTVEMEGLNDENMKLAWKFVEYLMRLSGSDIPVEIAEKYGAVLNKVNRERLNKIKTLAQEVLDSAEDEPEKMTDEDAKAIIAEQVSEALSKAIGIKIRR